MFTKFTVPRGACERAEGDAVGLPRPASYPQLENGAVRTFEINPEDTPMSGIYDERIRSAATEALRTLLGS